MATIFYLPSTGAAAVSPAYAAWTDAAQAGSRLKCVTTRISSAMASVDVLESGFTANDSILFRQYVSDPIPAQTISGDVTSQMRCMNVNTDLNHDQTMLCIKVVSNDGTTLRGTLMALGHNGTTNEFPTSLTNRRFANGFGLSSVVAQANDRIVIEFGSRASTAPADEANVSMSFGDDSGTDLPVDESTTAANNPYIMFSGNLFDQSTSPTAVASIGAVLLTSLAVGVLAVASTGVASGPGALSYTVGVAEGVGAVVPPLSAAVIEDSYSPTAATSVAEGISTFIMRATGTLGDARDDTGIAHAAPASWPTGTGTLLASQNIIGINLPDFAIAHVIFGARGVMTQDGNYLSNLRCDISGGSYALSGPWDDIRPYTLGAASYSAQCKDARSAPVTTKPAGGAWTWADLLAIPSATVKMDHSNITTVGHFAEIYVSEMYLEAFGPQGSYIIPLTRRLKAGNLRREFNIAETFNL